MITADPGRRAGVPSRSPSTAAPAATINVRTKYRDDNANGVNAANPADPGLSGWEIFIDRNGDELRDANGLDNILGNADDEVAGQHQRQRPRAHLSRIDPEAPTPCARRFSRVCYQSSRPRSPRAPERCWRVHRLRPRLHLGPPRSTSATTRTPPSTSPSTATTTPTALMPPTPPIQGCPGGRSLSTATAMSSATPMASTTSSATPTTRSAVSTNASGEGSFSVTPGTPTPCARRFSRVGSTLTQPAPRCASPPVRSTLEWDRLPSTSATGPPAPCRAPSSRTSTPTAPRVRAASRPGRLDHPRLRCRRHALLDLATDLHCRRRQLRARP